MLGVYIEELRKSSALWNLDHVTIRHLLHLATVLLLSLSHKNKLAIIWCKSYTLLIAISEDFFCCN